MKEPKLTISITLLLIVVAISGCIEENYQVQSNIIYVGHSGSSNYKNIQDAINASAENYTIFVYSGIYYENIVINKTINIIGEDAATTIIDGNNSGDVIYISEEGKTNISGFTIKKSGINAAGISIHSNNNIIYDNNISDNSYGIYSTYSQNNNFSQNTFLSNSGYGIYLNSVSDSVIFGNIFLFNSCGLRIKSSKNNEVFRNQFTDNQKGMYFCCSARYNTVFYNVFSNNSIWNAEDSVGNNQWDNEKIGIGNYWDDYNGTDTDGDVIGDTPYIISSNGQDNYPLIDKEVIN